LSVGYNFPVEVEIRKIGERVSVGNGDLSFFQVNSFEGDILVNFFDFK
jgi:hypothetical protein